MKKWIKRISIFLVILAILTGVGILIFRSQLKAYYIPTVEQIGEINVRIKGDTSYISSKLSVKNKSFFKIEIDTLKYKVSLFDKIYLHNVRSIGMVLPSYGKDTLDFVLKIPFKEILTDLKSERKKGDSTSYAINISLQYSTLFGKAEIPINRTAKIKIPEPPEIEIVEIKYQKIRRKSIHAIARIKIINYSSVTLSIKDMNYSMKILKQGYLRGKFNQPIDVKPNGATFITMPIDINVTNMGKTIFQVLINKDKYEYILTMNGILESTDPLKESFHIDLTKSGRMELKK